MPFLQLDFIYLFCFLSRIAEKPLHPSVHGAEVNTSMCCVLISRGLSLLQTFQWKLLCIRSERSNGRNPTHTLQRYARRNKPGSSGTCHSFYSQACLQNKYFYCLHSWKAGDHVACYNSPDIICFCMFYWNCMKGISWCTSTTEDL